MANVKSDEMVLKTIQQVIREVKQEMNKKSVLTESKQPEEVFDNRMKDLRRYITENVMKALKEAEK